MCDRKRMLTMGKSEATNSNDEQVIVSWPGPIARMSGYLKGTILPFATLCH